MSKPDEKKEIEDFKCPICKGSKGELQGWIGTQVDGKFEQYAVPHAKCKNIECWKKSPHGIVKDRKKNKWSVA